MNEAGASNSESAAAEFESAPAATPDSASPNSETAPVVVTTDRVEVEDLRERPVGSVAGAVADEQLQTWNVGGRSDPQHLSNRAGFHPGTRVRVDVTTGRRSKLGQATASRIQAALRNRGYWPLRNCYEDVARDQPDPGGNTWFRVTVNSRGALQSVRVLKTELVHRSIAACQGAALRQLRVESIAVKRFDADVRVSVWPGDVPLLPLPKKLRSNVTVDTRALSSLIDTLEGSVSQCMRIARARDPKLWGRLALSFAIDERGRPSDIRESQSQFGDAPTLSCVSELLSSLEILTPVARGLRFVAAWRLHRPELPQPLQHPAQPALAPTLESDLPEASPSPN